MSIGQELVLHKKSFQELTVDELYELLRVHSEGKRKQYDKEGEEMKYGRME